ncbi:hypothetical protein L1887_51830 [Cichorium endivia]|nr:hypothetical protein L1887_51830 [Cichorium endivia]
MRSRPLLSRAGAPCMQTHTARVPQLRPGFECGLSWYERPTEEFSFTSRHCLQWIYGIGRSPVRPRAVQIDASLGRWGGGTAMYGIACFMHGGVQRVESVVVIFLS